MNKYRNIFGSCDCEQGESAQPRVAAEQAIRAAQNAMQAAQAVSRAYCQQPAAPSANCTCGTSCQSVTCCCPAGPTGPTGPTAPSIYAQQGKCRNHAAFSTLKTIKQPL